MTENQKQNTDCPAHPGALLRKLAQGIPVQDLAGYLDVSRHTVSRLLHEKAALSYNMALRLEKAFPEVCAREWMFMQTRYDLWCIRHNPAQLNKILAGVNPEPIASKAEAVRRQYEQEEEVFWKRQAGTRTEN